MIPNNTQYQLIDRMQILFASRLLHDEHNGFSQRRTNFSAISPNQFREFAN